MSGAIVGISPIDDHRFFRAMATAMAAVLVGGFVLQLAAGRSSFSAPIVVHAHAVAFMGWVAITLTQVWLGAAGRLQTHSILGRLAVVYSLSMFVLGPLVTLAAVQTGRAPFVFQPQHFLIVNPMTVAAFFGLFGAAVALRKHTDWHMRLHVGAFAVLLGPGIGRILPLPLLMPYAFEIASLLGLAPLLVGAARDVRKHGRAHPAWWWGAGALVGALALARLVAFSPAGDALYALAIADRPAALSDGRAFPPFPGPPR